MSGNTMSHWEVAMRKAGFVDRADGLHSEKLKDMLRLRESGLPQFAFLDIPYTDFLRDSSLVGDFIRRYGGICVRALPNNEGAKRGFTRAYKMGYLSLEECSRFLHDKIVNNRELWDISLTEWAPNKAGFVIISGERHVLGEIGRSLEDLSHGKEEPLARFTIDCSLVGHVIDKTIWEAKGRHKSHYQKLLWNAFQYICIPGGNFDPYCLRGYFEGAVIQDGRVKFLDYKVNEIYLQ